jgi:uncharacterized protein YkwD
VLRHSFRVAITTVFVAFVAVLPAAPASANLGAPSRKVFVPLAMASSDGPATIAPTPTPPAPAPSPTPQPAPPQISPAAFEQRVIELINVERTKRGLPALGFDDKLTLAARAHSQDMADKGFFSHTGSNGSNPGDRISATGYDWSTYGENIAAGYTTPESVVRGWMESPGHRANILNRDVRELGVGHVAKSGSEFTHYWTNVLAAP